MIGVANIGLLGLDVGRIGAPCLAVWIAVLVSWLFIEVDQQDAGYLLWY